MATRIADRDRLGGGASTRYTINRSRSSSRTNPSQIDILEIDDSKARKTLQEFFAESKRETKSAADDIRKMWTMSMGYSDDYRKQAIKNINDIEDARDAAHRAEVRRINIESRTRSERDTALAKEMKQYNLDRIKYIKEINAADRQGLEIQRRTEELRKKYANTRLGKKIQGDLDKSQELRVRLESEYAKASSGKLSKDELIEIAANTDELEGQLAEANKRIERSIDSSERRSEGIKSAIKGFIKDAVTILTHNYIEGVQGYFNSYENTFTEFAGRLGTNYDQTRQFYSDIITQTYSNGMDTAISINKELIPAIQTSLRQGFTGDNAIAKAIADEQSRILMPWLDTASEAWVNMSFNMSKENMDLLKTQQLQLQTTKAGNRLLQSGVINSMTSEMEPLLRNIDLNTGGANNLSAEGQAMMASLVEQGMSAQDAYSLVLNAINVQKDLYGALTSGDVTKVLMGQAVAEGKGLFGQFENVAGLYGIASNGNYLTASALNDILGLNMVAGTPEIAREIADAISKKGNYIDITDKEWEDIVKDINGRLSATKSQENKQQNDAARVGEWITAIPQGDKWFQSVLDLGEAILAAVLAGFGGNVLNRALEWLGLGAGGKGILSRFLNGGGSGATNFASAAEAGAFGDAVDDVTRAVSDVTDDGVKAIADSADEMAEAATQFSTEGLNFWNKLKYNLSANGPQMLTNMWNSSFVGDWFFHNTELGRALNSEYGNGGILDLFSSEGRARIWKEGIEDPVNEWAANQVEADRAHEAGETFYIGVDHAGDAITDLGRWLYDIGLDTDWTRTAKGSKTQREKLNDYQQKQRDEAENAARIARINAENEQILSSTEPIPLYPDLPSYDEFMSWDIADKNKYFEEHGLGYYGFGNHIENGRFVNGKYFVPTTPVNGGLYQMPEGWVDPNATYWNAAPSYAVGSPYITKDQYALVHEGERILTPGQNEAFGEIGSTGLLLAGSTLINKLLGFSSFDDSDDDISREDMTETLVESLDKVTAAIARLVPSNGIDYGNRTLPRITNNYNSNLVNLVPSISTSK